MKKKIAIIGTGIAGMASAYVLYQSGTAEITVYEKNNYIGGHTRTRTVDYNGTPVSVDTGFIVFNYRNYPELTSLFNHLNVPVHKSDMTFGISVNDGELEWGAKNLRAVFGQWQNLFSPRFYRMISDVKHFFAATEMLLHTPAHISLGELLDDMRLGEDFRRYFLLPMGGAIWSCPLETMLKFPAQAFVRFFYNHGLLSFTGQPQWYTVTGGAQEYAKRLTAPFASHIRLNCGAVAVMRTASGVEVRDTQGSAATYDDVIFACHPDQTLTVLNDASAEERAVLGAFQYQKNIMYLHRDVRQMPKRKACWSSWVYLSNSTTNENALAVTYWMNRLQSIDHNKPLFVTLNPLHPIPDELVFDTCELEHPVFNAAAVNAQSQVAGIQGKNRAWFCGAWQRYGFHEDGLRSAVEVMNAMGVAVPWH